MILKAFKYKLFPNTEQQQKLNKTFGCVRFVYNWGLNEKSKAYANDKININCFELINKVTELKNQGYRKPMATTFLREFEGK